MREVLKDLTGSSGRSTASKKGMGEISGRKYIFDT